MPHFVFLPRSLGTCLGKRFFFRRCRKPATWAPWSSWIMAISSNFSEKCVSCLGRIVFLDVWHVWCDVFWCLLAWHPSSVVSGPMASLALWRCTAKFKSGVFSMNMQSLRVRFMVHQTWWCLSSTVFQSVLGAPPAPWLIWCNCFKVGSWDFSDSRSKYTREWHEKRIEEDRKEDL